MQKDADPGLIHGIFGFIIIRIPIVIHHRSLCMHRVDAQFAAEGPSGPAPGQPGHRLRDIIRRKSETGSKGLLVCRTDARRGM